MLAKLSEVLFVETVRRHVASLPGEATGWLAGAQDPIVGAAREVSAAGEESPRSLKHDAATTTSGGSPYRCGGNRIIQIFERVTALAK
jgi:hypothetical protein